jgi:hypothetical protein
MARWYAGVTCVLRGVIRCGRDCEVADFFFGAPNTGDAINTVAAKLVINPKRLVFISNPFFSNILSHIAPPQSDTMFSEMEAPGRTWTLGWARRTFNSLLYPIADAP